MATYEMQPTAAGGYVPGMVPDVAFVLSQDVLGSADEVREELDRVMMVMRRFYLMEPDEVLRWLSGISARMTELYSHLQRVEGRDRTYKQLRTQHVVPILDECDRQFKFHSRSVEVRRQDIDLMR